VRKAGKLVASCVPHAVLAVLKARGNIERGAMLTITRALAGGETRGAMALKRLRDTGLVALEYRLTEQGERALKGANRK
jgi:hypothetical protein